MPEECRPVRAWCDYDEWLVFVRLTDGNWDFVATPKGADGEAAAGTSMSFDTALKGRYIESALRSLRVLFDTGHELNMWGCWSWALREAPGADPVKWGSFLAVDLPDIQAVEQAIAEAVRWIGGQG